MDTPTNCTVILCVFRARPLRAALKIGYLRPRCGTDQALREAAYIAASSLICSGFFLKSVSMLRSSSAVKVSLARPFFSSTPDPAVAVSLVSKHSDVITQLMFRN